MPCFDLVRSRSLVSNQYSSSGQTLKGTSVLGRPTTMGSDAGGGGAMIGRSRAFFCRLLAILARISELAAVGVAGSGWPLVGAASSAIVGSVTSGVSRPESGFWARALLLLPMDGTPLSRSDG